MSPSLPRLSGDEVVKALGRDGFDMISARGSQCKLRKDDRTVIVPLHRELVKGTLASILRPASITADQLRELLD